MKMNNGRSIALLLSLLLPLASNAADRTTQLFSATSDAFAETLELDAQVNDNSDVNSFVFLDGKSTTPIALADLKKGVVIYQASGKNVATLASADFDPTAGGSLSIVYLQNGVNGTYRTFNCKMIRQGGAWKMLAADSGGDQKAFTALYLKANRLLGKLIGIQSIAPSAN